MNKELSKLAAGAALAALLFAAGLTIHGLVSARAAAREEYERTETIRVERSRIDEARRAAAATAKDADTAGAPEQKPEILVPADTRSAAEITAGNYAELLRLQQGNRAENNDLKLK